jgi:hypothetical protein
VEDIVSNARKIEEALVAYLWEDERDPFAAEKENITYTEVAPARILASHNSATPSTVDIDALSTAVLRHSEPSSDSIRLAQVNPSPCDDGDKEDPELAAIKSSRKARPVVFISAFLTGCSSGLTVFLMGIGLRE